MIVLYAAAFRHLLFVQCSRLSVFIKDSACDNTQSSTERREMYGFIHSASTDPFAKSASARTTLIVNGSFTATQ